ncbi:Putative hydroxypyruvate isomerase [Strongyloides ratti]|uniref:Putative hydroxypyruvate isomerase n=1 Tax=Strongyloides ratti TaxID=34506 RepID=A0A090L467_STRRB|nr:Putative hydroxypyruvate isomerase [Strongyloides ratti]CEF62912.1 Putative hydroxypyruvate isomerase [Strongyloides ratti]
MKLVANFGTLLPSISLLEKYGVLHKLGFKLIEIPNPYTEEAEKLLLESQKYGMKHILINAPAGNNKGIAINASKSEMEESINIAVKYANILGVKKVHVMAGVIDDKNICKEIIHETYVRNLKIANKILEENNIECLIEPINNYTVPGYFLSSYQQALDIINMVDSENIKILYDLFHAQQIQGQLIQFAISNMSKIGHLQGAQVPSRGIFIKDGEINYPYVLSELGKINCNWMIGAECFLEADDIKKLINKNYDGIENFSFMNEWLTKCNLEL